MSHQEEAQFRILQQLEEDAGGFVSAALATLRLNSATAAARAPGQSMKRPSPSPLGSAQEPNSKRHMTKTTGSPTPTGIPFDDEEFKINSPAKVTPTRVSPVLFRSMSDRYSSPQNPTTPGHYLYRSISDPISAYRAAITTSSPQSPVIETVRQLSPVSDQIKEESPSSKRLKRMKARMKEMRQWWNEVLSEDEEENDSEDNTIDTLKEDDHGTETEEAVRVEKTGECLIIHFKCPCGEDYQILLSGNNCYYKLM